jgi:hypothetical protein
MAPIIDPVTGQVVNLPGIQPSQFGGTSTPGLQPILPQIPFRNLSYGKPAPLETSDFGTMLGVQNDMVEQLFDPRLGAMASVLYGTPAFDWQYAQGQTNPYLGGAPAGPMGGAPPTGGPTAGFDTTAGTGGTGGAYGGPTGATGGSSGYSGGSSSGGFQPSIYYAGMTNSLQNTQDVALQKIRDDIASGVDPITVKNRLYQAWQNPVNPADVPSQEMQGVYLKAVDDLFSEKWNVEKTNMENQQGAAYAAQAGGYDDNPLMDYAKGWGLPIGSYGPGNWPADVKENVNRFMPSIQPRLNRLEDRMRRLGRRAEYEGVPQLDEQGYNRTPLIGGGFKMEKPEASRTSTTPTEETSRYLNQFGPVQADTRLGLYKARDIPGISADTAIGEWRGESPAAQGPVNAGTAIGEWERGPLSNIKNWSTGRNRFMTPTQQAQAAPENAPYQGSAVQSGYGGYGPSGPNTGTPQGSGVMWANREVMPQSAEHLPFEVQIQGNPYWTNQAGQQFQNVSNQYQRQSNYQQQAQNQFQEFVANNLAIQGRTPARDALTARLDALRQMGLAV